MEAFTYLEDITLDLVPVTGRHRRARYTPPSAQYERYRNRYQSRHSTVALSRKGHLSMKNIAPLASVDVRIPEEGVATVMGVLTSTEENVVEHAVRVRMRDRGVVRLVRLLGGMRSKRPTSSPPSPSTR